ncbi:MAG: dihydrolipoyl dehydrogenase [Deltaproteobacteria bacterium]|nr:dihydrolipoyl dehydrogenase [Deltaproteobacteria bacterium]
MKGQNMPKVAVIGAGPGGYTAAFYAADLGMEVVLIDRAPNPGGVCLYRGCIPSKALLHAAQVKREAAAASDFGLTFGEPSLDLGKLRDWKRGIVDRLTSGLGALCKSRNITYIQGEANFTSKNSLAVSTSAGGHEEISFDSAIVATGSRPASLPFLPNDSPRVMSSTNALELEEIPGKLLVLGGGYIGLELGTVYAEFGSEVTVVEMEKGILPGVDRDLVRPLAKRLEKSIARFLLNTRVVKVTEQEDGLLVEFEGAKAPAEPVLYDRVLVSVGRVPWTKGLGLEAAGLGTNAQGFIDVDEKRCTQNPAIYAIGDVTGQPMLAHKASHEGRVAVDAIAGENVSFAPAAIPAVIFTDPEIAWAGLSETEAKANKIAVEVVRFPWAASGRAMSIDRTEGLTKLLVEPETQRILGAGIVGSHAGELIAEATLAIEMAATIDDLRMTIHAHPTLSETVMEAAEAFLGFATHSHRPKRGARGKQGK